MMNSVYVHAVVKNIVTPPISSLLSRLSRDVILYVNFKPTEECTEKNCLYIEEQSFLPGLSLIAKDGERSLCNAITDRLVKVY